MDRFVPQVNACWRKCCTYPLCGGPSEEVPLDPPTAGVLGWSWATEDPVVIEPLPQIFTETAISEPTLSKRSDAATAANSFQLSPLKLVCTHSIYIRTVSSLLSLCCGTFVSFLPSLGQRSSVLYTAVVYQKPKLLAKTESFQLSAFGFSRRN